MIVKELWNFKYNLPILGIELADIDGNGQIEILAYTRNGVMLVISLIGKLLHEKTISKDLPIWHLKVYDIDNDGKNEIILGGMDGLLRVFKPNAKNNFELLWAHKFDSSISGIIIGDINNDKIIEVIACSLDKTLRILDPFTGNLIWGQVFEEGIGEMIIFMNDKMGLKKEIIACANDGTIRSFNGTNGKLLWYKKYSNKLRSITYMNTIKGTLVICGGDDKKLHIINKKSKNEIKTKEFNNYVWKCISYPYLIYNKLLVSSYSFDYLNDAVPIEKIEFTSNIICLNEFLEVIWETIGFNIEVLRIIVNQDNLFILAGTTRGELLIIEEKTGKILCIKKYHSCINMIQFLKEKKLIFSCHDDGTIRMSKLKESLN
ncbi:MAG: FG-GAP-like repeat-containing protein [Candidatus Hodarchaeota archaeon]